MDPEFHKSLQFSSLAHKPLKSQYLMAVVRWKWMDFEGFQQVGTGQKLHTWVEVALR